MSWREEFAEAATTWVIEHGYPANVEASRWDPNREDVDTYIPFAFSDESNEIKRHLRECELDAERTGRVRGFEWSQFEDTESPNSEHQGIGVDVVCRCGKVKRVFIVETTFGEMLQGILLGSE